MVRPGSMPRPRGATKSMCRRNRRERLSLPAQIKVLYYKGFRTGKAALFEVASHKDNDTFGVRRQAPKGRPRRFGQRLYAASRDRWSAIESGVFVPMNQDSTPHSKGFAFSACLPQTGPKGLPGRPDPPVHSENGSL